MIQHLNTQRSLLMNRRMVKVSLITLALGALLFGAVADFSAQAQQGGGPGARTLLRSFFQAMGAGDLALLKNGGAISGTIMNDEFVVTLDSGETQNLTRDGLTSILFNDTSVQLITSDGTVLNGTLATDNLTISPSSGDDLIIAKQDIQLTVFQLDFPQPQQGGGRPTGAPNRAFFQVFQGLQSQNIFGLFALSLTSFDMAVFPGGRIWSGAILNEEFEFQSSIFGTLNLTSDLVSSIQLGTEEGESDFITLTTGDRISGMLSDASEIQFQPVGLVDGSGNPTTLTLERGQFSQVSFRQPASAFGGGGNGPGFGGGPGN
jgi:hypothetical protein